MVLELRGRHHVDCAASEPHLHGAGNLHRQPDGKQRLRVLDRDQDRLHNRAGPARCKLHRERHRRKRAARRPVQRHLDRQCDLMVLGLRGRQHIDRAEPGAYLREPRQLHRQPDRKQRLRQRHLDQRGLHPGYKILHRFHHRRERLRLRKRPPVRREQRQRPGSNGHRYRWADDE